jgi:hypothetical protein
VALGPAELLQFAHLVEKRARPALGLRPPKTTIPSQHELDTVPLKVGKVQPLHLAKIVARMNERAARRLRACFDILFDPTLVLPQARFKSTFGPKDADAMASVDVARPVTDEVRKERPTRGTLIPFSVLQTKTNEKGGVDKERRAIGWTRAHNFYANQRCYKAEMGLEHIAKYTDDIRFDAATLADLKLSFWQVEIPEEARALYRFQDSEGRWFEMTRLPMGHSCSPEVMQIISRVLAGDPEVCAREFAFPTPACRVWVDNIRFVGTIEHCERAGEWLHQVARDTGAQWKAGELRVAVKRYDFLGATWDHSAKQLQLTEAAKRKFPHHTETMAFGELEALMGRLVHASGLLRIPLANFYFVMKFFRRRSNDFTNGKVGYEDQIVTPRGVGADLRRWITCARDTLTVPMVPEAGEERVATLFTDASIVGWGAILVLPTQQLSAAGDRWHSTYTSDDINHLEAWAVCYAVEDFSDKIMEACNVLRVVVDNTSVRSSIISGSSKSEQLAEAVSACIDRLKALQMPVTVEYISSKLNPADGVSRGREPEWAGAMGLHERGGGRRADVSRVLPLRMSSLSHSALPEDVHVPKERGS